LLVRPANDADLAEVTAIYAHHVTHGTGSFELTPPSVAEMTNRRAGVLANGLPYLVAQTTGEDAGPRVVGFAYANHFRPRPAYRFSVENSVYVAPEAPRQGIGRLLMAELIARCEAAGCRQMLAVIGDSANAGSIGLHAAMGFRPVGVFRNTGWKFDRWLDTVLMQRPLGLGDGQPPREAAGPSTR
jgi:phosphinothricin acetyltransferase